jgi:hypothetical protein
MNAMALRLAVEKQGSGSVDGLLPLIQRWKSAQFPDTPEAIARSPITNYSERDLLRMVQDSGYVNIALEMLINVTKGQGTSWDTFISSSPHPWAPTLASILTASFSADERRCFEDALRPIVEAGSPAEVDRIVYLHADKPICHVELR